MTIDPRRPIGELVAERISRASVCERFGIDYCCHGGQSLERACDTLGLDLNRVLSEFAASDDHPPQLDEMDYRAMSLAHLADHIEATHHAFMRQELPRLQELVAKVAETHGNNHPEFHELKAVYREFREEIESHLMKEERILFPMIRQLEAATTLPSFHCGSVRNPIRVMEHEHDTAGTALARMRELTRGFTAPSDTCASCQALMDRLSKLERDLHRHIHKENNILFPGVSALETRLAGSASSV